MWGGGGITTDLLFVHPFVSNNARKSLLDRDQKKKKGNRSNLSGDSDERRRKGHKKNKVRTF